MEVCRRKYKQVITKDGYEQVLTLGGSLKLIRNDQLEYHDLYLGLKDGGRKSDWYHEDGTAVRVKPPTTSEKQLMLYFSDKAYPDPTAAPFTTYDRSR